MYMSSQSLLGFELKREGYWSTLASPPKQTPNGYKKGHDFLRLKSNGEEPSGKRRRRWRRSSVFILNSVTEKGEGGEPQRGREARKEKKEEIGFG